MSWTYIQNNVVVGPFSAGAYSSATADPGLDAATAAWIAAVVTNGGTVSGSSSSGRRKVVNDLIVGLKADGLWTKLDRLWLFAAENAPSALTDLVGDTLASAVSTPTFTADRGYAGDGSTSYINTVFNAATQGVAYTLNSAHMAVWDNTNRAAALACQTGVYDGSNVTDFFVFQNTISNGSLLRCNSNGGSTPADGSGNPSNGLYMGGRTDAANVQAYRNGTSTLGPATDASTAIVSLPFFVCGRNSNSVMDSGTTDQISMASYGAGFTGAEATSYYNRMRTYMTAVGVP